MTGTPPRLTCYLLQFVQRPPGREKVAAPPGALSVIRHSGIRGAFGVGGSTRGRGSLMPLLVVAFPEIAEVDREWIGAIRAHYPELGHSVVPPHVTLVFPTEQISAAALQAHLAAQTADWPAIAFTIRCSLPVK